jgi:hypothetical protein
MTLGALGGAYSGSAAAMQFVASLHESAPTRPSPGGMLDSDHVTPSSLL